MTGTILGFDTISNTGTISGANGQRYHFDKSSFKEHADLKKNLKVDFNINDKDEAIEIYSIRDTVQENTGTLFGLIAVVITFFLSFLGTFIARLVLAKQPLGQVIVPTLIHFVCVILVFIPVLGWIIYLGATAYFMYKNYMLVTTAQA